MPFVFFVVHKQCVKCCWGLPKFLPCGLSPDIYYLCNCVELVCWFCIHILTTVISVQIQFTDMESKMFKEDQLEHKEEDSLKTSCNALGWRLMRRCRLLKTVANDIVICSPPMHQLFWRMAWRGRFMQTEQSSNLVYIWINEAWVWKCPNLTLYKWCMQHSNVNFLKLR